MIVRLLHFVYLVCLNSLAADVVKLRPPSQLTGVVKSLNEEGQLSLLSPLCPAPLLINRSEINAVVFPQEVMPAEVRSTRIDLWNGDFLHIDFHSLDANAFSISSASAGRLTFPRSAVKAIQFGLVPHTTFYSGPKQKGEWINAVDSSNAWNYSDDTLWADGPASSSRSFTLPAAFNLKFSLKWENQTNFHLTFADPFLADDLPTDRYRFSFDDEGIELQRESKLPPHFQTIFMWNRTPDSFPANQVQIEIRVDRLASRFYLFLNGKSVVAGFDPSASPPGASGITLINRAPMGAKQIIENLLISSLDHRTVRDYAEVKNDSIDTLITHDEDRFSGELLTIAPVNTTQQILFKSPSHEDPLRIHLADVSTLFLAQSVSGMEPSPFQLLLRDGSSISATTCEISDQQVSLVHPTIGSIKLALNQVVSIEHLSLPTLDPISE